ncbi:hypothetical protein RHSIM_Rhsim11G0102400 [Rhododendron simsii]|uniref:Uncharacterized protein n=1 Tax=Rhododendron simsii TaxID=118357 RepID=A0A834L9Z6_RHOSS|nr:hypothetical protein RHSIM_Rhsim11G0102400 [Rhododendron simsii]
MLYVLETGLPTIVFNNALATSQKGRHENGRAKPPPLYEAKQKRLAWEARPKTKRTLSEPETDKGYLTSLSSKIFEFAGFPEDSNDFLGFMDEFAIATTLASLLLCYVHVLKYEFCGLEGMGLMLLMLATYEASFIIRSVSSILMSMIAGKLYDKREMNGWKADSVPVATYGEDTTTGVRGSSGVCSNQCGRPYPCPGGMSM